MKTLLASGADVNYEQIMGTALTLAAHNGHAEVVSILIDAGADIDYYALYGGGSALKIANYGGHLDVVKILKDAGATENEE